MAFAPLSTALYDQARALVQQGLPQTVVAKQLGIHRNSVRKALTACRGVAQGPRVTPLDADMCTALSLPPWPSPSNTKPSLTNT